MPIVLVVGIGSLPGVLVAFVFAVPPIIRLTNLGLRNVPVPMFEAAQALGASPTKILISVEIPNVAADDPARRQSDDHDGARDGHLRLDDRGR